MSEEDEPGRAPLLTPSEGERAPSDFDDFPGAWVCRWQAGGGCSVGVPGKVPWCWVWPRVAWGWSRTTFNDASLNILQTLGNLYSLDQMLVAGGASLRKN